jgi:hypothetical protein
MVFEPHVRGIKILSVQLVPGKIKAHIVGGYPGRAAAQVCVQYGVSRFRVILQESLVKGDWLLCGVLFFGFFYFVTP